MGSMLLQRLETILRKMTFIK
ncbi:hypothetical protein [Paenibacillus lautus]